MEHQERLYKISQNILNGSQKVDVMCQNRPQNTLKWPPEDVDMMSKKSISDNQSYAKNTWTKFHDKILNRYQEKYVYMPK